MYWKYLNVGNTQDRKWEIRDQFVRKALVHKCSAVNKYIEKGNDTNTSGNIQKKKCLFCEKTSKIT